MFARVPLNTLNNQPSIIEITLRIGQQVFVTAILTLYPCKAEMKIASLQLAIDHIGDIRPPESVVHCIAVLPVHLQLLKPAIKSEIEASAKDIIQSISTEASGWPYLGSFVNNKWTRRTIEIGNQLPTKGKTYKIIDDVYLRDSKPVFPLYKLGNNLGVLKVGETIQIGEFDPDVGKNRIWAKVVVITR